MRIRNVVVAVVSSLVVIVSLALAWLATVDVDDYRGQLDALVERATGRAVEIGGQLELSISLSPTFSVERVRLASAPWATQASLLTIERLEAQVSLPSLLRGPVEVRRFRLVRPVLELETRTDGSRSWDLQRRASPTNVASGDLSLRLGSVSLEALRVTHRDARTGAVHSAEIPLLKLERGEQSLLAVHASGTYQGEPFTVDGGVGRLVQLFSGEPYPVDLAAAGGGVRVEAEGIVRDVFDAPAFAGRVAIAADDAAAPALRGLGLPAGSGLALSGELSAAAGRAELPALVIELGESRASGAFTLTMVAGRPAIDAALDVPVLDLEAVGTGANGLAAPAGRVIPDAPLRLSGLRAADVNATLRIAEMRLPGVVLHDVAATVTLDHGLLAVDPFSVGAGSSRARGSLHVDAAAAVPDVVLELEAGQVDLHELIGRDSGAAYVEGLADVAVEVSGRGRTVAELMASLDGEARAMIGDGRVRARSAEMIVGGLSALMSTMADEDSQWTHLGCAVADFTIADGIATPQILLADTDHAIVTGEGTIDLAREVLALKFTPTPKKTTLNLALPIKVGGTFSEPTFRPDELAVARRVGAVAMMVFPPAALAGLGSLAVYGAGTAAASGALGSDAEHPCLAVADGEAAGAEPAQVEQPETSKVNSATESLQNGIGNAAKRLKGLFSD